MKIVLAVAAALAITTASAAVAAPVHHRFTSTAPADPYVTVSCKAAPYTYTVKLFLPGASDSNTYTVDYETNQGSEGIAHGVTTTQVFKFNQETYPAPVALVVSSPATGRDVFDIKYQDVCPS